MPLLPWHLAMPVPSSTNPGPMAAPERRADTRRQTPPEDSATVEIDSRQLLLGAREVLIRHGNEHYRLRHTRNDKLILTK